MAVYYYDTDAVDSTELAHRAGGNRAHAAAHPLHARRCRVFHGQKEGGKMEYGRREADQRSGQQAHAGLGGLGGVNFKKSRPFPSFYRKASGVLGEATPGSLLIYPQSAIQNGETTK